MYNPLLPLFAYFPLHSYPPILPSTTQTTSPSLKHPTLWVHPPSESDSSSGTLLSSDVECLKWQAYIALRGLSNINLRWDISTEGGVNARLPSLYLPKGQGLGSPTETKTKNQTGDEKDTDDKDKGKGQDKDANPKETAIKSTNGSELHAAQMIPTWVDLRLGVDNTAVDSLEGYNDEAARDESRAWVSLLESIVHPALILCSPQPSFLALFLGSTRAHSLSSHPVPLSETQKTLQTLLTPPPLPLIGLTSLFPISFGTCISVDNVLNQYRDGIASLSERLGTDKWFLGSSEPTPLDALVFAYLHCILQAKDTLRVEVTRRVNLVAWEWRVREVVRGAFVHDSESS